MNRVLGNNVLGENPMTAVERLLSENCCLETAAEVPGEKHAVWQFVNVTALWGTERQSSMFKTKPPTWAVTLM